MKNWKYFKINILRIVFSYRSALLTLVSIFLFFPLLNAQVNPATRFKRAAGPGYIMMSDSANGAWQFAKLTPAKLGDGSPFYTPYQDSLLYLDTTNLEWYAYTSSGWQEINSASSLWETDGTNVWRPTGNVGIQETTPDFPLHVGGQIMSDGNISAIHFRDADLADVNNRAWIHLQPNATMRIQYLNESGGGGGDFIEFGRSGNSMTGIELYDNAMLKNLISNSGDSYFSSGSLAVGGTVASATLDVQGTIQVTGLTQDDAAARIIGSDADGNFFWVDPASIAGTTPGIDEVLAVDNVSNTELQFSSGADVKLNSASWLYFENEKHLISNNDGAGNFNIRIGNLEDETITEKGHAFHTEYSQTGGWLQWNISQDGNVGDAISWNTTLRLSDGGSLTLNGEEIATQTWVSNNTSSLWETDETNVYRSSGNVGIGLANPAYDLDVSGDIHATGEFISDGANGFRIAGSGGYGTFLRSDALDFYIMLTNSGDKLGGFNSFRPFKVNLASGDTFIGGGSVKTVNRGLTTVSNGLAITNTSQDDALTKILAIDGSDNVKWVDKASITSSLDTWTADAGGISYTGGNVGIGVESKSESNFQAASQEAGAGNLTTPWIYTTAIESQYEKGASGTAIIFNDDNFNTASNEIAFITNGARQVFVDAQGDLGVGVTNANAKLDVAGNIEMGSVVNNPSFRIYSEDGLETSYAELLDVTKSELRINKVSATGDANIRIVPEPQDNQGNALVNLFRTTNTTGSVRLDIHRGDNSGTTIHRFISNEGNSWINAGVNRNLAVGHNNPSETLDVDGSLRVRGLTQDNAAPRVVGTDANGVFYWMDPNNIGGSAFTWGTGLWENPTGTINFDMFTNMTANSGITNLDFLVWADVVTGNHYRISVADIASFIGSGGGSDYSFNIKANGGTSTTITDGETIDFIGGSGITISRSANNLTFSSTGGGGGMDSWNWGINGGNYTAIEDGENVSLNAGTGISLSKTGNATTVNSTAILNFEVQANGQSGAIINTTGEAFNFIAGDNIDITRSGNNFTFDATGGGGGGMTSFRIAPDVGSNTISVTNDDVIDIVGYTDFTGAEWGIQTFFVNDDELSIALDLGGLPTGSVSSNDNLVLYNGLNGHFRANVSDIVAAGSFAVDVAIGGTDQFELNNNEQINFESGSNVTITNPSGNTIRIAATGGGGGSMDGFRIRANSGTTTTITDDELITFQEGNGMDITRSGNILTFASTASGGLGSFRVETGTGSGTSIDTDGEVLVLEAGANMTISRTGNTFEFASTGGGSGVSSVGEGTAIDITGTASNPVVNLDINELGTVTPSSGDYVGIYDISTGFHRKVTVSSLQGAGVTVSGGSGISATQSGNDYTLNLSINEFSQASYTNDDYLVFYERSGGIHRLVEIGDLPVSSGGMDNFNIQAEGGIITSITDNETINFVGGNDISVSRTGNSIFVNYTGTSGGGGVSSVSGGTGISVSGTSSDPVVNLNVDALTENANWDSNDELIVNIDGVERKTEIADLPFQIIEYYTPTANTDPAMDSDLSWGTFTEVWAYIQTTSSATSDSQVFLPIPSSTYSGKKVVMFSTDQSSSYDCIVTTASPTNDGLFYSGGGQDTYPIGGSNAEFYCFRHPNGKYYWFLKN